MRRGDQDQQFAVSTYRAIRELNRFHPIYFDGSPRSTFPAWRVLGSRDQQQAERSFCGWFGTLSAIHDVFESPTRLWVRVGDTKGVVFGGWMAATRPVRPADDGG